MKQETWINNMWRPAIAWSYLIICLFDFLIAPITNAIFQATFYSAQDFTPWQPITLSEGGLYHAAMLTIVGVTSWGRTQEKLKSFGMRNDDEEPDFEEDVKTIKKTVKKVTK